MGDVQPSFRRGVVRPMECFRAGWELIKPNYWLFLGISVVGYLIASVVPFGILMGPMLCGIFMCLFAAQRGRPVKFEMLFKGFDHFVPSLVVSLLMMVPLLAVVIAGYVIMFVVLFASMPTKPGPAGGPPPGVPVAFWLAYAGLILAILLVSLLIGVVFFFAYPLIVDRKLAAIPAIKTSWAAARANLGGVIGVVVLSLLLNILGELACCVGMFFVLPMHFGAVAVAYRQVFPDEQAGPAELSPEERDYDDQLDPGERPPERREDEL
jgi:hypothetical protein